MDYMDYVDYVAGGVETLKHKYPWLVYVKRITKMDFQNEKGQRTKVTLVCTGALLDQSHVLIAAHCINKEDYQFYHFEVKGFSHSKWCPPIKIYRNGCDNCS